MFQSTDDNPQFSSLTKLRNDLLDMHFENITNLFWWSKSVCEYPINFNIDGKTTSLLKKELSLFY